MNKFEYYVKIYTFKNKDSAKKEYVYEKVEIKNKFNDEVKEENIKIAVFNIFRNMYSIYKDEIEFISKEQYEKECE
ncbi:MAG: hypothetical protein RR662_03880 [Clostridia bacterium]